MGDGSSGSGLEGLPNRGISTQEAAKRGENRARKIQKFLPHLRALFGAHTPMGADMRTKFPESHTKLHGMVRGAEGIAQTAANLGEPRSVRQIGKASRDVYIREHGRPFLPSDELEKEIIITPGRPIAEKAIDLEAKREKDLVLAKKMGVETTIVDRDGAIATPENGIKLSEKAQEQVDNMTIALAREAARITRERHPGHFFPNMAARGSEIVDVLRPQVRATVLASGDVRMTAVMFNGAESEVRLNDRGEVEFISDRKTSVGNNRVSQAMVSTFVYSEKDETLRYVHDQFDESKATDVIKTNDGKGGVRSGAVVDYRITKDMQQRIARPTVITGVLMNGNNLLDNVTGVWVEHSGSNQYNNQGVHSPEYYALLQRTEERMKNRYDYRRLHGVIVLNDPTTGNPTPFPVGMEALNIGDITIANYGRTEQRVAAGETEEQIRREEVVIALSPEAYREYLSLTRHQQALFRQKNGEVIDKYEEEKSKRARIEQRNPRQMTAEEQRGMDRTEKQLRRIGERYEDLTELAISNQDLPDAAQKDPAIVLLAIDSIQNDNSGILGEEEDRVEARMEKLQELDDELEEVRQQVEARARAESQANRRVVPNRRLIAQEILEGRYAQGEVNVSGNEETDRELTNQRLEAVAIVADLMYPGEPLPAQSLETITRRPTESLEDYELRASRAVMEAFNLSETSKPTPVQTEMMNVLIDNMVDRATTRADEGVRRAQAVVEFIDARNNPSTEENNGSPLEQARALRDSLLSETGNTIMQRAIGEAYEAVWGVEERRAVRTLEDLITSEDATLREAARFDEMTKRLGYVKQDGATDQFAQVGRNVVANFNNNNRT